MTILPELTDCGQITAHLVNILHILKTGKFNHVEFLYLHNSFAVILEMIDENIERIQGGPCTHEWTYTDDPYVITKYACKKCGIMKPKEY